MSFLTLLTRVHPARAKCLERCMASVKAQTDQDVQQLLLRPEVEPNDVIKVGPLIYHAAPKIEGRYVAQLPDDDRLRSPDFVKDLKKVIGPSEDVDMIIYRMEHGTWLCPPQENWVKRQILPGLIAGQNIILKRSIYDGARHEWLRLLYEADYYYVLTAFKISKKVVWWDYIGMESQGLLGCSQGRPESQINLKPGVS